MSRPRLLVAAFLALSALVGAAAWQLRAGRPGAGVLVRATSSLAVGRRLGVDDPLSPGRRAFALAARDEKFPGIAARASDDRAWLQARPDPAFRYERTPAERGGVDPCALPKAQQSHFSPWKSISAHGYVAFPERQAVSADGSFDTMLVFHGHDVAWTELATADVPIVLYGTTLGDYRSEYAGPEALAQLIAAVELTVSNEARHAAHARHVALAAWSGGYDAISVLLEQSSARERVDAVALLDGLHGSRDPEVMPKQLAPFVAFARRAAEGKVFMFVSHSSVETDAYASTTETMHFLASELGGRPLPVRREDPLGLELIELFDRGDFHLRGYAGGGKRDHCAELGLYPEVARALARRWH